MLFPSIINIDSNNSLTLRCTLTPVQDPLNTYEKKDKKNFKMDLYMPTVSNEEKNFQSWF